MIISSTTTRALNGNFGSTSKPRSTCEPSPMTPCPKLPNAFTMQWLKTTGSGANGCGMCSAIWFPRTSSQPVNAVEIKSSAPQLRLDEALEYLIDNTFSKMAYITKFSDEPKRELQSILRANDIQKAAMTGVNDRAMDEVRDYISLSDRANHPVVLFEMIEKLWEAALWLVRRRGADPRCKAACAGRNPSGDQRRTASPSTGCSRTSPLPANSGASRSSVER